MTLPRERAWAEGDPAIGPGGTNDADRAGWDTAGLVYPSLPAVVDTGLVRFGGAGIGNCFFPYFHAALLAERTGQRLIAPAWGNVGGVGAFLRRDHGRRRYAAIFRRHADEIGGARKAWALATRWPRRRMIHVGPEAEAPAVAVPGGLSVVALSDCWFGALLSQRAMVRRRLIDVLAAPPAAPPSWGSAAYAAVHVRLGDFAAADGAATLGAVNTRLPMAWYVRAIDHVRSVAPDLPILLFSDGHDHELAPLLAMPGVRLERGGNDVDQLIAMASARLFVGSNSTFSGWAAFLGNMPTIWATPQAERLSGDGIRVTVLDRA